MSSESDRSETCVQESRRVHRISYSETHTDSIGKCTKIPTDTEFRSVVLFIAYYKFEAKHCLVKAVRDTLFFVRYVYFVSKPAIKSVAMICTMITLCIGW